MLSLVLKASEQDQVHMSRCICYERFQINLLLITCHFELTYQDKDLDFSIKSLPIFFLHAHNLYQ